MNLGIGLDFNFRPRRSFPTPIVLAYDGRVIADGGTVEGSACASTVISRLNAIPINGGSAYTGSSLIFIPSGYKAGTAYSYVPTDGGGDFDMVRASSATRTNNSGILELESANVPRLDYRYNGALQSCPALLVEPAATNLLLRSTWQGGGATPTGWASLITGSSTPVTSVLGSDSVAYSLSATSQRAWFSQTITVVSGTSYCFSFYVEQISAGVRIDEVMIFLGAASNIVYTNPDNIIIPASTVITKTGRYKVTVLSTGTNIESRIGLGVGFNRTGALVLSRPQLETGSVATSYIPTVASTATRNADVISLTGVSSYIGQTEGAVYGRFSTANAGTVVHLSDGTANNSIAIDYGVASSGVLRATITVGGIEQSAILSAPVSGQSHSYCLKYKAGDAILYIDDNLGGTGTPASIPACNTIYQGSSLGSSSYLNGHLLLTGFIPNEINNMAAQRLSSINA